MQTLPAIVTNEPETREPARCTCGETLAPDGACLNIGACETANERAARGSFRETAKYRAAAWQGSGSVD